jgi:hypothetical protein
LSALLWIVYGFNPELVLGQHQGLDAERAETSRERETVLADRVKVDFQLDQLESVKARISDLDSRYRERWGSGGNGTESSIQARETEPSGDIRKTPSDQIVGTPQPPLMLSR